MVEIYQSQDTNDTAQEIYIFENPETQEIRI